MAAQQELPAALVADLRERWTTSEGRLVFEKVYESLRQGDENWPEHLNQLPAAKEPLAHSDIWVDLRGLEVKNLPLRGAMLAFVDLSYATFDKCDLRGICLQTAKLSRARFKSCNMQQADLLHVVADHASFEDCQLQNAMLGSADFSHASFKNAKLTGSTLDGSDLRLASLNRANLKGAHVAATKFPSGFDINLRVNGHPKDDLTPGISI
jgi:uncharacterized protein YjbI with pentapeptide repeats